MSTKSTLAKPSFSIVQGSKAATILGLPIPTTSEDRDSLIDKILTTGEYLTVLELEGFEMAEELREFADAMKTACADMPSDAAMPTDAEEPTVVKQAIDDRIKQLGESSYLGLSIVNRVKEISVRRRAIQNEQLKPIIDEFTKVVMTKLLANVEKRPFASKVHCNVYESDFSEMRKVMDIINVQGCFSLSRAITELCDEYIDDVKEISISNNWSYVDSICVEIEFI